MGEHLLEVKGLSVEFSAGARKLKILEDISFSLNKGEALGVVGESGCGKSVMATSIMGLLPKGIANIVGGEILFNGIELVKASQRTIRDLRGRKMTMIFQDPMAALNPVYSVEKQMIEMLRTNYEMQKHAAHEIILKMLAKVGISSPEQRLKDYPYQLSGGIQQRIMIAMALSTNPELLIADEPTTALDVTIQAQVLEVIKGLQQELELGLILITHDMGVVANYVHNVLIMYAGEIVEYGDVNSLFHSPMHPYTSGLLRSIPKIGFTGPLFTIPGTVPSIDDLPAGCRFSTRCPECMEICLAQRPELCTIGARKIRCWKYVV